VSLFISPLVNEEVLTKSFSKERTMKEKITILLLLSLFVSSLTSVIAKPVDVLLMPTTPGKTSRYIPLNVPQFERPEVMPVAKRNYPDGGGQSSPFSVDMVLAYDNGTALSSLGGLASGFHLGVWFKSPSACTLLQVQYYFYTGGDVTFYVSDPADTIDFYNDYEEYHGGVNPGPSPIETYLHPEVSMTAPAGWTMIDVTAMPDVAKDVFFAAWIMDDGNSSPYIDASISPPYHTIMQRPGGGGGPFGWYTSYHHVYVRALVRMYENPPPAIAAYDALPYTYLTVGRAVTCNLTDLGIPLDSTGVVRADMIYSVGGAEDTLPMTLIGGDPSDGTWEAILPGIDVGQTMTYHIECYDMQGLQNLPAMTPVSYTVLEKTSDILFVNDDYYGVGYAGYDVISDVIPYADWWDIPSNGEPDASVLGAGYRVMIWNTWEYSGATFANAQTLIEDYLDGGGNLLVSGMDIPAGELGYDWGVFTTMPGEFLYDYFGIIGGIDDYANPYAPSVYFGRTGDEICGIFNEYWPITSLPYGYLVGGPGYNYAGKFDEPIDTTQWKGILYDEWGYCSAFRYEQPGVYRVVWLAFPFAFIYDYANPYEPEIAQQQMLIERILDWLDPGPMFRDLTQYTTTATPGPYPVDVTLINFDETPIHAVNLVVSANGVMDTIAMAPTDIDTTIYAGSIPAYTAQTEIRYYVSAIERIDTIITPSDTTFDTTIAGTSNSYDFWFLYPSTNYLYVNESYDPSLDYQDALDSLAIPGGYNVFDPAIHGQPDSSFVDYLATYAAVIWNGDWGYGTMLTKESATNVLYDYLLSGGNIFFNSDEILGLWDGWSDVDYYPGEFPYDVLQVDHIYNDICYDSVYGVTGDPISDGIIAEMTFPLTNWNDEVGIFATADAIFTDFAGTTVRGVKWSDSNNKVVFLPFMVNALPKSTQVQVLRNSLIWFGTKFKYMEEDKGTKPLVFALSQSTPNPCKNRATISYAIPKKSHVTLNVYNAAGQLVKTLINGQQEPGFKTVVWNGQDKHNRTVAQGVYFYRLTADNNTATRKLLIVR
jgi:hypothetical protein